MADSQAPGKQAQTAPAPVPVPAPVEPPAPPRWLTWAGRRPLPLLALLGLLLWLPGILSLPPIDRDESRFAQSSRQMVETGNWVDIRFGHVPRYKKPVGIYWLQAAATAIAGGGRDDQIWTYRLPSLLGAIAASWLTLWCALAVTGAEAAFLAGLLMLGTTLLTGEATLATTDAVLLACALGVQGVLLRLYRAARDPDRPRPSSRLVMWGWAAMGFGILVKGPVVIGLAAATAFWLALWDGFKRRATAADENPLTETDLSKTDAAPVDTPKADLRKWRPSVYFDRSQIGWLRSTNPLWGMLLVLLLISPWLIAITIQSQGAFLEQSLGNDFAAKIAGGQESHGAWPGYYLLLSAASFWPTILFVLPAIVQAIAGRAAPGIRFLLAWAASWWLIVELLPTKLPHYVLEAYPALAILAAIFVLEAKPIRFLTPARWIAIVQFGVGAALFVAVIILAPLHFGSAWSLKTAWPVLIAACLGAVLAMTALVLAILKKFPAAALLSFLALLVFVPGLTVGAAPRLDDLWVTQRLKHTVALIREPGDPAPALAGYEEPSMLFAFGADTILSDGAGAAEAVAHHGGLALVEDSERGPFLARLAELQADAAEKGEVSGFNYSRGRKVHVTVYRVARIRDVN
ncbi:MAG TPA: glycosyltransferase family 39 protein [Rhizomicrobium sp.]|nr:glycosyltransferase family 39 protein [Rhizomicrobium sp.]